MGRVIDVAGQRFNRLVALEYVGSRSGRRYYRCACDCGVEIVAAVGNLRKGDTQSCGCLKSEVTASRNLIHGGAARSGKAPEYESWRGMMARCYDPKNIGYARYGGRGITVCERWHDYAAFLEDMGAKPGPGYSLDRLDPDKGYSPQNCRWADDLEQANNKCNNRFIDIRGEVMTLAQASRRYSVNYDKLKYRIKRGDSPEAAIAELTGGVK